MSKLRVLMYKEWRDQRALVVGSLIVCVLLIAVAKFLGGAPFDALIRTKYVLPSCIALFAVVIATESIARDAQNTVEQTVGRLPVSRALVWCAKSCFVALSFLGSLAVLAALEQGLRLLEHKSLPPGTPALISPPLLFVIAAAAAACLAAACILKRSLPAAFLGLVLLTAVPFVVFALPPSRVNDWATVVLCSWTPAAFSVLACGALLLGSLLAFRVRRADGSWMRRATAVALGTSIVLVPAIAETAREQAWAFEIKPFSPRATISQVVPSPDGRYAAIAVEQDWKAHDNWSAVIGSASLAGEQLRREVWILDRSTGKCREIDGRFRWLLGSPAWDSSGRLVATSSPSAFGTGSFFRDHIDPLTATVVESHEVNPARELIPWYWKRTAGTDCVLRWKSAVLRVPKDSLLVPSPRPGVVFQEQDGFLVRHELAPESTTRLLALGSPGELRFLVPSPDGSLLSVNPPHGVGRIIDACTGELVHEFQGRDCHAGWSQVPGRICLVWTGEEYSALNEDGSLTPMPARGWGWEEFGLDQPAKRGGVIEWGPDRLLAWSPARIECMELDGSDRQVLYEARP